MGNSRVHHDPQRQCILCRTRASRNELTRVVGSVTEGVHIDPDGRSPGRGAYVCLACRHQGKDLKETGRKVEQALRIRMRNEELLALTKVLFSSES